MTLQNSYSKISYVKPSLFQTAHQEISCFTKKFLDVNKYLELKSKRSVATICIDAFYLKNNLMFEQSQNLN